MNYDALIVIDIQTALVEEDPYNRAAVVANVKELLNACRAHKIPVVYIQHVEEAGGELAHGSAGWEIYSELAPLPGEKVFEKHYNSAFRKTGLRAYLDEIGAKSIIICGMQTEYCIDASCKVAFEYEYEVTIPRSTTTTYDTAFASGKALSEFYEESIWNGRYARVIDMTQVLTEINK